MNQSVKKNEAVVLGDLDDFTITRRRNARRLFLCRGGRVLFERNRWTRRCAGRQGGSIRQLMRAPLFRKLAINAPRPALRSS